MRANGERFLAANDLQLSVLIFGVVTGEELIVLGEIADHVLRRVSAKHFRHARIGTSCDRFHRDSCGRIPIRRTRAIRHAIEWRLFWPGGPAIFRFRFGGVAHEGIEVASRLGIERLVNRLQLFERLGREFAFLLVNGGEICARRPENRQMKVAPSRERKRSPSLLAFKSTRLRQCRFRLFQQRTFVFSPDGPATASCSSARPRAKFAVARMRRFIAGHSLSAIAPGTAESIEIVERGSGARYRILVQMLARLDVRNGNE